MADSPPLPRTSLVPPARGVIAPAPDALPPETAYLRPTVESAMREPLLEGPFVGETVLELIDAQGLAFRTQTGTGYELIIDTSPDHGGASSGFEPLGLVAVALGGCTAVDALIILRKKRQVVTGYRLRVATRQVQEHPQVYSHFVVLHILQGRDLDPRAVARSIELAATKYCPVGAMLAPSAEIIHAFRIVPES